MFVAGIDAHATYSVIAIVSNTGQLVQAPVRIKSTELRIHDVGLHLERGRLHTQDGRDWLRTVAWPLLGSERLLGRRPEVTLEATLVADNLSDRAAPRSR